MAVSHFDEKSGIIPCNTEWGRWWQTVDELHIEITLPVNTKSKDVKVNVTNSSITCQILGKPLFSGNLFRKVRADDTLWTLEDNGTLLNIVLTKADYSNKENVWEAIMEDGSFKADPITYIEMMKKMDLEKLQMKIL
ncbi:nudC domain-containing protein 2 isoform X1 [Acyrthosiphon pisum]|uniref:CS domain-containing protein n=1 Tax=Acyrthosiphon pisum TaxID=7029 RepID=A0A8R2B4E8_ACYPI|nr:nudC domain-containing protein 2 isoform X1 [Acyrthosiphon pisum]|eukprot:XP_008181267.1 PREDICTED: nudC domain-containing protein 2 isoform X1 [Acyrthosiphon pisum]